jgi:hypothetical protein
MQNSSNPLGTASAGSLEAAANAFEDILSGSGQDTEEPNEAPQGKEPSDEADDEVSLEDPGVEDSGDDGEAPQESEDDESEDDSDEEEESDEDDGREPIYTVKVDGQEVDVPLSELVKGYSRTADYTRKTQEIAAIRKQAEAVAQESIAARDQYAQRLVQLDQLLQQQAPQEPNWELLRATDPIEFAAQWADHQRRQQVMQQVNGERQAILAQQQQEHALQMQQRLEHGRQWLTEAIPEWRSPETAKAERAALKAYGKQFGYSEEELAQVADPRAVVLLRKAMMYDRMQEKRGQIKPAKKAAAPVMKPGPATQPSTKKAGEVTRAKQRLAKTGKLSDAAAVFKSFL